MNRILAIEAATRIQSIALVEGDQIIEHRVQKVRYDHGSVLVTNIEALMQAQKRTVHDVDLFAVGTGPGSFTGLRVAMAVAKALARATGRPIVGVSSLAALAHPVLSLRPDALVCATIDARRQEVYAGLYAMRAGRVAAVGAERTIAPAELAAWVAEQQGAENVGAREVLVAGDGPVAYPDPALWSSATVVPRAWEAPSALSLAMLARQRAEAGSVDELVSLEPNYIRPSDAELPRSARPGT